MSPQPGRPIIHDARHERLDHTELAVDAQNLLKSIVIPINLIHTTLNLIYFKTAQKRFDSGRDRTRVPKFTC